MEEVEDNMETSCCPKALGILGFLTDLWYPWVFGFYMPFDDSAGAGKICSIVFLVLWTVLAVSSLVYMGVPDVKSRLWITMCYFIISLVGAAMNIAGICLAEHQFESSNFTTQLSILLTFRLLQFVFVGTYLRQLKKVCRHREATGLLRRIVNNYSQNTF